MAAVASHAVAVVGCGFAADLYMASAAGHPELSVVGAFDRDPRRAEAFAAHHGVARYPDLEAVLADDRIELVLNLTNPESHYEVSRRALLADKHIYSEKPLAMSYLEGEQLVQLAEQRGLVLSVAPCTLLGETAQTIWRAVRRGDIGRPQLVYAELDDGAIHRLPFKEWRSASGAPWPYRSEFRTGCTLEHAGYHLSWLLGVFGSVAEISGFATNIVADVPEVEEPAPDFVSSCLRFRSGVVARLTCSIVAPRNHSLVVVGDEGALLTWDVWDYGSPVYLRSPGPPERPWLATPVRYPLLREPPTANRRDGSHAMDFARGVAETLGAATEQRPTRLPARHALHALDLMLSIADGENRRFTAQVDPVEPMPWARDDIAVARDEPGPLRG